MHDLHIIDAAISAECSDSKRLLLQQKPKMSWLLGKIPPPNHFALSAAKSLEVFRLVQSQRGALLHVCNHCFS